MRFHKEDLDKPWIAYTIAACAAVVLFLVLSNIKSIGKNLGSIYALISPVFNGIIIAYILNPIMSFFERTILGKMRNRDVAKKLALILTVVFFLVLAVIFFVLLIPQVISSIATLVKNINRYSNSAQELLQQLEQFAAEHNIDISDMVNAGENMVNNLVSLIPQNLDTIINTSLDIGAAIFNLVISIILSIYFLADKERITTGFRRQMRISLSARQYRKSMDFWSRCNSILLRYIGSDILDALIIGVVNSIFMTITGMPFMILISIVVAVTNLAPTFGPIVGGVLGGLILVLDNPWYALGFLAFTLILQTIDGYVIKPKLFGDTLGVPAVWILITIILGGRIFGIPGVLLSIPAAAILAFMYNNYLDNKERKQVDEMMEKLRGKKAASAGAVQPKKTEVSDSREKKN